MKTMSSRARALTKRRRIGKREKRPQRQKAELLEYLVANDIRSSRQLQQLRQGLDPTVYDYIRAWGDWQGALDEAWGPPEPKFGPPTDAEYLVNCVLELNLWRRDAWRRAHKARPSIVPSVYQVLKHFSSFSDLFKQADNSSFKAQLASYHQVWRRLGRRPSLADCAKADIGLDKLIRLFGSKWQVDQYMQRVEAMEQAQEVDSNDHPTPCSA